VIKTEWLRVAIVHLDWIAIVFQNQTLDAQGSTKKSPFSLI
jgi:hypothetical protein